MGYVTCSGSRGCDVGDRNGSSTIIEARMSGDGVPSDAVPLPDVITLWRAAHRKTPLEKPFLVRFSQTVYVFRCLKGVVGRTRARTWDPLIKSQLRGRQVSNSQSLNCLGAIHPIGHTGCQFERPKAEEDRNPACTGFAHDPHLTI
jgi:hypothetical protein